MKGAEECGGEEAKTFLEEVLTDRDVTLQFDMECTDIYQRTLAWVVLQLEPDDYLTGYLSDLDDLGLQEDGSYEVLVNEWLVRAGFAYLYEGDLSDEVRYGQRMEEALEDAERQELGSSCTRCVYRLGGESQWGLLGSLGIVSLACETVTLSNDQDLYLQLLESPVENVAEVWRLVPRFRHPRFAKIARYICCR